MLLFLYCGSAARKLIQRQASPIGGVLKDPRDAEESFAVSILDLSKRPDDTLYTHETDCASFVPSRCLKTSDCHFVREEQRCESKCAPTDPRACRARGCFYHDENGCQFLPPPCYTLTSEECTNSEHCTLVRGNSVSQGSEIPQMDHASYLQPSPSGAPNAYPQQPSPSGAPNAYPQQPSPSGATNAYPQQPSPSGAPNAYPQQPSPSGETNAYPQQPSPSGEPNAYPQQPSPSGAPNAYPQQPSSSGAPNVYPQQPSLSATPGIQLHQPSSTIPSTLSDQNDGASTKSETHDQNSELRDKPGELGRCIESPCEQANSRKALCLRLPRCQWSGGQDGICSAAPRPCELNVWEAECSDRNCHWSAYGCETKTCRDYVGDKGGCENGAAACTWTTEGICIDVEPIKSTVVAFFGSIFGNAKYKRVLTILLICLLLASVGIAFLYVFVRRRNRRRSAAQ